MPAARTTTIVLLSLLLTLVAAPWAWANTLDVHADYLDNGVIDRPHSIGDLKAALAAADGDPQYAGLSAAITEALDHELLGRDARGDAPGSPDRDPLGVLPQPRLIADSGGPPLALVVLTTIGGLLVLGGAGSSLYRRTHRRG